MREIEILCRLIWGWKVQKREEEEESKYIILECSRFR